MNHRLRKTPRPLNRRPTGLPWVCAVLSVLLLIPEANPAASPAQWSATETSLLATLRLQALPPVRQDPGNRQSRQPEAAAFGAQLFFAPALSREGTLACASCHRPEWFFTDRRATAHGREVLTRNTPSLLGVAHEQWWYWDGRADSLWSQALQPLEAAAEMGNSRVAVVRTVLSHPQLGARYRQVFGPAQVPLGGLPAQASPLGSAEEQTAWAQLDEHARHKVNRVFTNIGKALAAYESTLQPAQSRFDRYVDALMANKASDPDAQLTAQEQHGLRVFISGRSGCLSCHHGPRFTDRRFHNVGTGNLGQADEDIGRYAGRQRLEANPFNCRSRYAGHGADAAQTDAGINACQHLTRMYRNEVDTLMRGAFRTPTLRNISETAPYMHDGRFATLDEVMQHYREPPDKTQHRHELEALRVLSDEDIAAINSFLQTLSGPAPEMRSAR